MITSSKIFTLKKLNSLNQYFLNTKHNTNDQKLISAHQSFQQPESVLKYRILI